ncbi:hypothetical protein ACE2AJ_11000 [Aquihabitans daechungensis]|uniref:hypothetical protein n=1 Tax=Aquihabitans daechungensis TaxID=1052257 RepID=UPI003B9FD3FA
MEKVLYVIAHPPGSVPADLTKHLVGPLADELHALGAASVQVNVADHDVSAAGGLRMAMSPAPANAVVAVWVDSATDHLRAPFDEAVRRVAGDAELAAYLVTESVPLANTAYPAAPGERTPGMAQLAFLRRPEAMAVDDWLEVWLGSHTHVALELQETFAYVQNVIVRTLLAGTTTWHAIVEECFPAAAMTDPHVFFDAVGDDEKLARHQREMFESVQRFIDLSIIDVVPTSRYLI